MQLVPPNPILFVPPEETMGLVQGTMPDSINEWYVAEALDFYQVRYFFQFVINGGTTQRGGQVVDFLVQVAGWVPVFVNGAYWHDLRHDPEQVLKMAEVRHRFGVEPVILEEEETSTREKARAAVRKKVLI